MPTASSPASSPPTSTSTNKAEPWKVSLGFFGAGELGASYQKSFDSPLAMLQAEKRLRLFGGLPGNYRAYAWHRSDVPEWDGTRSRDAHRRRLLGRPAGRRRHHPLRPLRQADQRPVTVRSGTFGRRRDQRFVLGSRRRHDRRWAAPGCASHEYRQPGFASGCLGRDSDDNCTGAFNYNASGAEKVAEIYYRYRISPQFDLTPDFQWIGRPGANPMRIRSRSSACAPTSPSKEPHAMSNRPAQRHRPDSIWFALLTAGALLLTALHCRRMAADDMPTIHLLMKDGRLFPETLEVPANTKFRLTIKNEGPGAAEFESLELRKEPCLPRASRAAWSSIR